MSRYLSHLAELTLNQVEPVQPRLASRFETLAERSISVKNGWDSNRESRISAPPVHGQPAPEIVTDSPDPLKIMPQRLASRFETPVREPLVNNGLKVSEESQGAPPAFAQPMRNNTKDRPDPVKPARPQADSQFETRVNSDSADTNHLDVVLESGVAVPPTNPQSSKKTATDQAVTPRVGTTPTDGHSETEKQSSGKDQPRVFAPTGYMFQKFELAVDQQKPSSGQNFASFNKTIDTAQASRATQSLNNPVAQTSAEVRKDAQPKENIPTLVKRVQEHYTETTHKEFVIRETAALDCNQKTSKTEESPRPAPVKPNSIVVRSEQTTFVPNTPGRTEAQSLPPSSSSTVTAPAPTIQVTIGRIEVRATQVADKPATKPRAASNTMSLDDYLNRRNGGKS